MSRLKLHFLGQPHIELDGASVKFDTSKATALLAYLALTGHGHTREALATLLWPEYEQRRALANLRRTLWALNKAGLKPWLETKGETVGLLRGDDVWVDVDAFHALTSACQTHAHPPQEVCPACVPALAAAADLQRGNFLAGFTLRDSPEFDDWQSLQSEALRREVAAVLQRLVQGYSAQGDLDNAVNYGRRWLALDPLHEPAQRRLMELYARTKGRSAALRQYEECVRILDEELGIQPEAETTALYERIRAGEFRRSKTLEAAPPNAGPPARLYSLPVQPTAFVGRQEELGRVAQLLGDPACRLLTLVGPGGIGKTRLAIEAAGLQAQEFAQGVCFIPLGGVSAGAYVIPALVTALALPPRREGKDLRADVLTFLESSQILLVMDSFEHLVEDARLLGEILHAAPGVRMLVTSRERLNLQEEWVLELGGMKYPAVLGEKNLLSYSAIDLFLQSARRARVGFAPSESDMQCIVRICQLVEGMPLGIELAAAWVRALSCEQVSAEIEHNVDFLATRMRDLPERHRSLRAVFDSSWMRLTESERRVFAALSVFRGGFAREAAEAVAGADLLLLSSLVDKSFVRRDADGRYSIHELLRQFGEEELERLPAFRDAAHSLHSEHYLQYLHDAEDSLKGPQQQAIIVQIKRNMDNGLLAWQWAVEHSQWDAINGTLQSLLIFYDTTCWFHEGLQTFESAAQRLRRRATTDEQQAVIGRLLVRQGVFAERLSRMPEARELLEEGLEIARQKGTSADASLALYYLGWIAHQCGQLKEGRCLLEESVELCRPLGDGFATAIVMNNLGSITSDLGDYAAAQRLIEESLEIKRALGDRRGVAFALGDLAIIALRRGEYARAKRLSEEGNRIMLEIGDQWAQPSFVATLADVAYLIGDYGEAERGISEVLRDLRTASFPTEWGQAMNQVRLARIYCATGRRAEAEELVRESIPMLRSLAGLTRWYPPAELALVEIALGDYAAAERFAEESLAAGREMAVLPRVAAALDALGKIAYVVSDHSQAQQHCGEALALFEAMGTRYEIASCLDTLANATRAVGEYKTAGELLGRAQAIADEIGAVPLWLEVRVSRAELLAELRGAAPGHDAAQQAQDLLDQPLHDARAFAHTRERAENLRAKLRGLSQSRG